MALLLEIIGLGGMLWEHSRRQFFGTVANSRIICVRSPECDASQTMNFPFPQNPISGLKYTVVTPPHDSTKQTINLLYLNWY